jgi:hypothetical protein
VKRLPPDVQGKIDYLHTLIASHQVWCPRCGLDRSTCPSLDRLMRDEEMVYRIVSGQPPNPSPI